MTIGASGLDADAIVVAAEASMSAEAEKHSVAAKKNARQGEPWRAVSDSPAADGDPDNTTVRVEIIATTNGWAIRARSSCACMPTPHVVTIRAVYALTLRSAIWRFRFARREGRAVEEDFNV